MDTPSRRFLMPTYEGGGNVAPELGVARRLIARGHHVHVLADPTIGAAAESAGCTFSPWRRAPHRTLLDPLDNALKDWKTRNPLIMLRRAVVKRVMCPIDLGWTTDYAADTADAINAFHPDVVVPDSFLFGSIIAAQAASLPIALLVPNIWLMPTAGLPPIGLGFAPAETVLGRTRDAAMLALVNRWFAARLPPVNSARTANGLPPLSCLYDQALDADRLLVLTSPAFDYAAPFVPANVRYVGPILDDPDWADPWTPPWPDDDKRPLVLVGFSSTDQHQGPVLRRVVEALSTLPVRAVVTLGPMVDAGQVPTRSNVAVIGPTSHRQILADASLSVSHCGHGTTMKTLTAGVPMVCIPMGRDQNDTSARIVHHGAGVRLPARASALKIRKAVQHVLARDQFRVNAARLGNAIADQNLTSDFVSEIEILSGLASDQRVVGGTSESGRGLGP